jgi:acyl-CoA reductase-like NAD-dependent aldehyde dehydrogenase
MIQIPILRHGEPYTSLDVARVAHHKTGVPFVEVSQANVGVIRRDLLPAAQAAARRALLDMPVARLLEICRETADRFVGDTLPLGRDRQTADDFVEQVSATTGMPYVLVRRNMDRIAGVLREMRSVLSGLTRGMELSVLDTGVGAMGGHTISFFPRAESLGVVLPNNSPGVHSLWTPAIPLKMPLVLKPGSAELWSPFRIAQAFIASGAPKAAFSYYPADHAAAGEILRQAGRGMFFGDAASVGAVAGDPRIELHGPGFTKIFLAPDQVDRWQDHVDLMVASIVENAGRSCVNASGVWTPRYGREIADALAARLAAIVPRAADDEQALLAPFTERRVAEWINGQIDAGLSEPGAIDVTAAYRERLPRQGGASRDGGRLVQWEGGTYLLPTIVYCDSPSHPLANREFLFPFASVVEMSADEAAAVPAPFGPTLVVTALTTDRRLIDRLIGSPIVDRLNVGPIKTNQIAFDQPHEGNLFDHLYARRSYQQAV